MFEQYKLYASDLANIGSRYAAANTFYMSVLTALTGLLASTEGTKPLHQVGSLGGVVLPGFAAVTCMIWTRSVGACRRVFAAKFQVLKSIEQKLDVQPYTEEDKALGDKHGVTGTDQALPWALAAAYGVIAAVMFGNITRR